MIKLMSNDELKLHNDEVTSKKAWEERKERIFGRGISLMRRLQNISYQKTYTF